MPENTIVAVAVAVVAAAVHLVRDTTNLGTGEQELAAAVKVRGHL